MKEIAISCFDLTENIAKNALIKNKGSNYFDDIEKVDFTNEEVKKEIQAFSNRLVQHKSILWNIFFS